MEALDSVYEFAIKLMKTNVSEDEETGIQMLKRLYFQGYPQMLYELALLGLNQRIEGLNSSKIYDFLVKAAENGHTLAIKQLAECYRFGILVHRNERIADRLTEFAVRGAVISLLE